MAFHAVGERSDHHSDCDDGAPRSGGGGQPRSLFPADIDVDRVQHHPGGEPAIDQWFQRAVFVGARGIYGGGGVPGVVSGAEIFESFRRSGLDAGVLREPGHIGRHRWNCALGDVLWDPAIAANSPLPAAGFACGSSDLDRVGFFEIRGIDSNAGMGDLVGGDYGAAKIIWND